MNCDFNFLNTIFSGITAIGTLGACVISLCLSFSGWIQNNKNNWFKINEIFFDDEIDKIFITTDCIVKTTLPIKVYGLRLVFNNSIFLFYYGKSKDDFYSNYIKKDKLYELVLKNKKIKKIHKVEFYLLTDFGAIKQKLSRRDKRKSIDFFQNLKEKIKE